MAHMLCSSLLQANNTDTAWLSSLSWGRLYKGRHFLVSKCLVLNKLILANKLTLANNLILANKLILANNLVASKMLAKP